MAVVKISKAKCIGCEQCLPVCPTGALKMENGVAVVIAELCNGCGECVAVCPTEAILLSVEAGAGAPAPEAGAEAAGKPAEAAAGAEDRQVWVFVEQTEGRPAGVSWELLGKGREIADALGGQLAAVMLGHGVRSFTQKAIAYGADLVYLIDDPVLAHYRTEAYLHGMVSLARPYRPEVILLGATTMGRDLAGAVATKLETGLTADCTGLSIDPQTKLLEQTRPAYGGNIMATILCEQRRPQMATVRPRVMAMPREDEGRTGRVIEASLGLTEAQVATRVLAYAREEAADEVRLEDAEIIVSGGRGVGSAEGFSVLQELADALGGIVAGSRGAVDVGWVPPHRQVGQTGKTVRPKVYFACGISGAIQHLVGMQTADVIVAINSDPEAPIFKVATYGIVGDLFQVVPALAQEVRARRGEAELKAAAS